jgi:hypothetical protein
LLHVTHEEAARHHLRRHMLPRTAELFRRASRLCRRAVREAGGTPACPECLIATKWRDVAPGNALLARLGLEDVPVEDLPSRADSLYYARRWRTYELRFGETIVLIPKAEWLPAGLREALRLGRASSVTTVPKSELRETLERLGTAHDARVRWARLRPAPHAGEGVYDLRVRLQARDATPEVRATLALADFHDADDFGRFVRGAVGEEARFI